MLGPDHPDTLRSVNNLALLYIDERRYVEAEPLSKRLLEARERVLGKDHPDTLTSVNNLAGLYYRAGPLRRGRAARYRRAIEARERVLGSEHPDDDIKRAQPRWAFLPSAGLGPGCAALASQHEGYCPAHTAWRAGYRPGFDGREKAKPSSGAWHFGFWSGSIPSRAGGPRTGCEVSRETFRTSQWAQSSAAGSSLAEMAARGAKRDPKLSPLVRERQDLVSEWQKRDRLRNEWLGGAANKRDPKAEAENNARLAARIDARIGEIDKELAVKFPDYAALASGAPLPVEEVQAELRPGEALVLFLDTKEWEPTPEETFIWVVTKADMRWVRSDWVRSPFPARSKRCAAVSI